MTNPSPIVPPFTAETAHKKVKIAQDLWNTKTPEKVALAYTVRLYTIYLSSTRLYVPRCAACRSERADRKTRSGATATSS